MRTEITPVFNYDLAVMDRVNQITNLPWHGTVHMIFPASVTDESVTAVLIDLATEGMCKFDPAKPETDNSGTDQDLYYEVLVCSYEMYVDLIAEMTDFWKLAPIAVSYIPSREEVGL